MSTLSVATPAITHCAHCGDECRTEKLFEGDQAFCCAGCRTVYSLLREHGLQGFYDLAPDAARSQRRQQEGDYGWLDAEGLAATLAHYHDEDLWRVELELPAIHCIACVWLLERLPTILGGVQRCQVDVTRKVATISFDPRITSLRGLAEFLARLGYPPVLRRADRERRTTDRSLLYRIGVAGFCFGNVMLLSFPEYLGLGEDAGATIIGKAVGPAMLLLSLPVLLYAASGFYRDALAGLRAHRLTLDVPIVVGMLALFGRSAFEIFTGSGAGYLDSLTGLVFFLLIGRWFQSFTFTRLSFERDYHDYFPVGAYRRDAAGNMEPVATAELSPGDEILVRPGQVIPTDGILVDSDGTSVDYSFVTGESRLRPTLAGDIVFAGGRAVKRALTVRVTRPADESYLMQLWRDEHAHEDRSVEPPQQMVRVFTGGVLLLAVLTFAYWYRFAPEIAYRAAVSVLIIACPCALALAAPFAYGTLQRLLGRAGCYLSGAGVISRVSEVDTFVFDKTGTLIEADTSDELIWLDDSLRCEAGTFLAMSQYSSHPRSEAITTALTAEGTTAAGAPAPAEEVGLGLHLCWHRRTYRIGGAEFCGITDGLPGTFATVNGTPAFRILPPRPRLRTGVHSLLRELSARGEVYLLSGDDPPTDDFWEAYLPADRLHFSMSPFAKQAFVERLQANGKRILMVGDGLNDTGALRAAEVGIAVREEESVFSPASDAILSAERLGTLPTILLTCRRLRWVTFTAYTLALLYNLVGLSYAMSGALSPIVAAILMPLSSISVVLIACGGSYLLYRHDLYHPAD